MIPSEPDADTPDGERYVFGRLRARLGEDCTVLHARTVSFGRGSDAPAGEIGFLVIDPARGMLALEVAESDDALDEAAERARQAALMLEDFLGEQPALIEASEAVRVGWAVGLAERGSGEPRAELRERLIGPDDLPEPTNAIARAFRANAGMRPPPAGAVAAMIRALGPALRLVRPLTRRIRQDQEVLVRLTAQQARVLDQLELRPRIAIEGGAGTGKTLLAAEWARRLAARGRRTLLLCFNRALAEFLTKSAEGYAVGNFHRLCYELAQAAELPFEVPARGPEQRRFWDDEAPRVLVKALESRPGELFDAVVVDEGQDFRPDWWPAVEALLREPGEGSLVVFFDPLQDLFGGGPPEALVRGPTRLTWNCRSTERIARFSHAVIGAEVGIRPGTPEGTVVELSHVKSDEETVDEVRRVLERLIDDEGLASDQIVVLSTRSRERSSLGGIDRLGELVLEPFRVDPTPGRIRVGSLHQFKGLESDVILLIDVHAGDPNSSPGHVYVGASRARHLLVVIELRYAGR